MLIGKSNQRCNHDKRTNQNTGQSDFDRRKSVMDRPQTENRPQETNKKSDSRHSRGKIHYGTLPDKRKTDEKSRRTNRRKHNACSSVFHKRGNSKMKCPDCGSLEIKRDSYRGENYCVNCGLIVADSLPEKHSCVPEGRFAQSLSSLRAGGFMPDGKVFKAAWMLSAKEKNIMRAGKRIKEIANALSLPKYAAEEACSLYKKAIYKNLTVGRDNRSLGYASVYAACHICGLPKTIKDILKNSTAKQKNVMKAYKLLKEEFKLNVKPCDPQDYVHTFTSKLNLSNQTTNKIIKIVEKLKKTNIFAGRKPESILAAAIYLGCKQNKEPKTQREISAVVGVIEITIRKRYKEIEKRLNFN